MEMTRRKFVRSVAGAASAVCAGLDWFGRKASPRRIVRAVRLAKYPGRIVPLGVIGSQSKWSG